MSNISTDRRSNTDLNTWHRNGPFKVDMLYAARQRGTKNHDLHNESVAEVQKLMAECLSENKRFRAIGSLWSLNDIAFNESRLHANTALDMRLPIDHGHLHPNSSISHDNLVFAQCGTTVNQLESYLEGKMKSLKVSGGSNGQTIAGAISTGVHGGAFDYQCISDYVKGLHLIIGPNPEDRVYLERSSERILNDHFVSLINSRLIADDDLFNAALVGLGSFGFIAAVVMEVEGIFSLTRGVAEFDYNEAINIMQDLDTPGSHLPPFKGGDGISNDRPHHFKTYINQYTRYTVGEVIFKVPYVQVPRPTFEIEKHLHPDIFRLMHWALEKTNGNITELLVKLTQGSAMPNPKKETQPVTGTLGDIFHSVNFIQPGFSWALGVDNRELKKAMETFLGVFQTYKVPGLSAIKLVRQTRATIGFHKFPITAVIHMDGIQWDNAEQQRVQEAIVSAFHNDGIEFTLHWGKNAKWDYPGLIDLMYPGSYKEWIKQRARLLRPETAELFSNTFIERLGLDAFDHSVGSIG